MISVGPSGSAHLATGEIAGKRPARRALIGDRHEATWIVPVMITVEPEGMTSNGEARASAGAQVQQGGGSGCIVRCVGQIEIGGIGPPLMGNVPHFDESRLRLPQQLHGCAHGGHDGDDEVRSRAAAGSRLARTVAVWPPVAVAVAVADGASVGVAVAVEVAGPGVCVGPAVWVGVAVCVSVAVAVGLDVVVAVGEGPTGLLVGVGSGGSETRVR